MMVYVSNWYCWVILFASIITAFAAVVALVSENYEDTLPECVALSLVAISGVIVTLQIYTHGYAMGSGFAFQAISVAAFALAQVLKNSKSKQGRKRGVMQ